MFGFLDRLKLGQGYIESMGIILISRLDYDNSLNHV